MPTYDEQVIADGAVAYWRLNDAVGATTAASSVGGVAAGTITGGVTLGEPGPIAGATAMRFDGISGRVTVPVGAYSDFDVGPLTLECWGKISALPGGSVYWLDTKGGNSASGGAYLRLQNDGQVIAELRENTLAANQVFTTAGGWGASTFGRWRHFALVMRRGPDAEELWIDGVLISSKTSSFAGSDFTSTQPTAIGASSIAIGFFPGWLAEVALYQTALTPTQIATHYAFLSTGTPTLPLSWASFGVTEDLMVQAYNNLRAVTPSDTVDLPALTQAIWVGGTGNVAVVTQNNVAATLTAVPAGAWLPIAARRINATNTTATAIVALYQQ